MRTHSSGLMALNTQFFLIFFFCNDIQLIESLMNAEWLLTSESERIYHHIASIRNIDKFLSCRQLFNRFIRSIEGKKKHTRIQNQYLSMNDERNNRKYYLHLQRFFMCVQKVNVDTNLFDWNAAWQLMRLVQCDDLLSLIKLNWLDLKRDDGKCIWQFDFFVFFFCTRQGNYAESVWIYKHILGGMCHDIQNVIWAFNLISQEYIYGWNEWEISSTWIKTLVKVKTNTIFSSVPATIEPLLVSFYPYPCYNLYDDYFMVLFQVGLEILNS